MATPLVEFRSVVKRFGDFVAVERVNFTIEAGEFVAIMGPSGCGKTTTLRMLAGLEAPSEGEVVMDGRMINDVPAHDRDTPLVWQSLALFPFLNARENVEFGLQMRGVGASERRRRALEWLDRMEIVEFDLFWLKLDPNFKNIFRPAPFERTNSDPVAPTISGCLTSSNSFLF